MTIQKNQKIYDYKNFNNYLKTVDPVDQSQNFPVFELRDTRARMRGHGQQSGNRVAS